MMTQYQRSVLMIILGGICLSTLGIGTRLIESADGLQVVLYRAIGLGVFSTLVLMQTYKGNVFSGFKQSGWPGFIAGVFFSLASIAVVMALVNTTVANAMFVISLSPLFTALFAWLLLKEKVSFKTWMAIAIAILGVLIIVNGAISSEGMVGIGYALLMAIFYALFNVSLRFGKHVDMVPAICWSSYTLVLVLIFALPDINISINDLLICLSLGVFQIGLGAMLLIAGSKHVSAAQLALLAMVDVVFNPLWVWLGVGEEPSTTTLVGGAIILLAVAYQALSNNEQTTNLQ